MDNWIIIEDPTVPIRYTSSSHNQRKDISRKVIEKYSLLNLATTKSLHNISAADKYIDLIRRLVNNKYKLWLKLINQLIYYDMVRHNKRYLYTISLTPNDIINPLTMYYNLSPIDYNHIVDIVLLINNLLTNIITDITHRQLIKPEMDIIINNIIDDIFDELSNWSDTIQVKRSDPINIKKISPDYNYKDVRNTLERSLRFTKK